MNLFVAYSSIELVASQHCGSTTLRLNAYTPVTPTHHGVTPPTTSTVQYNHQKRPSRDVTGATTTTTSCCCCCCRTCDRCHARDRSRQADDDATMMGEVTDSGSSCKRMKSNRTDLASCDYRPIAHLEMCFPSPRIWLSIVAARSVDDKV